VEDRNNEQKNRLFEKIVERFGENLKGKTFGIWGLSFKPGTDDMREASSVVLIQQLIEAGALVKAYDPVAMEEASQRELKNEVSNGELILTAHQYDAVKDVDAMVLVTEWKPFRQPDFIAMKKIMKNPVIFDGRNQYDPEYMIELGFHYDGIGRRNKL
jgi:UDPglucose 6-dehydrogenase